MPRRYDIWKPRSQTKPESLAELMQQLLQNRSYQPLTQLSYGDHGLEDAYTAIRDAILQQRRIALYADYDVDGTMSCVSWVWFFRAIGFTNFTYYIPDRFKEGYGLNLNAISKLIEDDRAEMIITMDTGITANAEAAFCRQRGVQFVCTDHHKIQPEKMPDSIILNPKLHPDSNYQELCGCGVTFVLLRKLGREFNVEPAVWNDLLGLAGIATICDVVPLNAVNHKLARLGVEAIARSQRPIFRQLLDACADENGLTETDIGFRIGPRINAVGRLYHAMTVVRAFVEDDPSELLAYMQKCNEERRQIQSSIVEEAQAMALKYASDPIIFVGGDWHIGVVGIAASKVAETRWRPTWLFHRGPEICKGSARSIPGFDVTDAMSSIASKWTKFGGHQAAGGYAFRPIAEQAIREGLLQYAASQQASNPELWKSSVSYDCDLELGLANLELTALVDQARPFGQGFDEPCLRIEGVVVERRNLNDRKTGEHKHTLVKVSCPQSGRMGRVMFFSDVMPDVAPGARLEALVQARTNIWQGRRELSLVGVDWQAVR